eukprot:scaffold10794_cov19-Tisochrysis_lutea.AAC.3
MPSVQAATLRAQGLFTLPCSGFGVVAIKLIDFAFTWMCIIATQGAPCMQCFGTTLMFILYWTEPSPTWPT